MTFQTGGTRAAVVAPPRPWRAPAAARLSSLTPFLLAVALQLFAPAYCRAMLARPPEILGIPLGVVVGALILAWAAFGSLIVWTTRSRLFATLALGFLTIPSIFAMILGPAVILILQNLG